MRGGLMMETYCLYDEDLLLVFTAIRRMWFQHNGKTRWEEIAIDYIYDLFWREMMWGL